MSEKRRLPTGYLVKAAAGGLLVSAHVHHNRRHHLQVALHICMPTSQHTLNVLGSYMTQSRPLKRHGASTDEGGLLPQARRSAYPTVVKFGNLWAFRNAALFCRNSAITRVMIPLCEHLLARRCPAGAVHSPGHSCSLRD